MYMIHRFLNATIFGASEEYEELTNYSSMMKRLVWLDSRDDGYSYWAEDAEGSIYDANGPSDLAAIEPCGYCGTSRDPNDICEDCWDNMSTHTSQCHEYWDRGLECRCIPEDIKQAMHNGADPEDVM